MGSIPASNIVSVLPGVLSAGGNALSMVGLMLTNSARVPIGSIQSFTTAAEVALYFGPTSTEFALATTYFSGFVGATQRPAALPVAQYNQSEVAAWLRGGNVVAALSIAQLQAITSGSLTVVVDNVARTAASINLSSANSYSAAASLIQTALDAVEPTEASFTGSLAGNVLTVSAVSSGTLAIGQTITGASVPAGTIITALGTGTGETGTYTVSTTSTVTSESMQAVTTALTVAFDAISGAFVISSGVTGVGSQIGFATGSLASTLLLTSATGAVISQGAVAASPATFMNALINQSTNWATFFTSFDPDNGSGNAVKLAFAAWTNTQNNRFGYVCWDADAAPASQSSAPASLGALIAANSYSGTCLIWTPNATKAAFAAGYVASLDFDATNGRATFKFRWQSGLPSDVSDPLTAANLTANGYNYYGVWATAAQNFTGMAEGVVSGSFQWFDTYVDQIWLNSQLQLALMNLLWNIKSIPYNATGDALIEAACLDPINAALNYGAIRAGVLLSSEQASEMNTAAGRSISDTVAQQGWYLQVLASQTSPQVRQARGTPPCNFWWTDGESVHKLVLNSVTIQ